MFCQPTIFFAVQRVENRAVQNSLVRFFLNVPRITSLNKKPRPKCCRFIRVGSKNQGNSIFVLYNSSKQKKTRIFPSVFCMSKSNKSSPITFNYQTKSADNTCKRLQKRPTSPFAHWSVAIGHEFLIQQVVAGEKLRQKTIRLFVRALKLQTLGFFRPHLIKIGGRMWHFDAKHY